MRLSYLLRAFCTAPPHHMQFTVCIGQGGRSTSVFQKYLDLIWAAVKPRLSASIRPPKSMAVYRKWR